jgi:hypothetical protein
LYFNWLLFHYIYHYCSNHDPERKTQSLITEREDEGDYRSGIKSYLEPSGNGKAAEHARKYK